MTGFFSTHTPHPAKNLYGSQSINFYIVKIQIFGSKFWSAPLSTGPRPREESGADQKRRCDTSNGETQYHGWCLIWGSCCIHTCSTVTIESIAPLIYLPTIIWLLVTANLLCSEGQSWVQKVVLHGNEKFTLKMVSPNYLTLIFRFCTQFCTRKGRWGSIGPSSWVCPPPLLFVPDLCRGYWKTLLVA